MTLSLRYLDDGLKTEVFFRAARLEGEIWETLEGAGGAARHRVCSLGAGLRAF